MAAVTDIFSPRAHYVSYQAAHSQAVPRHEVETLYTQSQHKTWGGLKTLYTQSHPGEVFPSREEEPAV